MFLKWDLEKIYQNHLGTFPEYIFLPVLTPAHTGQDLSREQEAEAVDTRVLKTLLLPTPIRNNRKIIDSDTSKPPLKPTVLWNCYFFLKSHFELRYIGSVMLRMQF